jgi:hypothetical protein
MQLRITRYSGQTVPASPDRTAPHFMEPPLGFILVRLPQDPGSVERGKAGSADADSPIRAKKKGLQTLCLQALSMLFAKTRISMLRRGREWNVTSLKPANTV